MTQSVFDAAKFVEFDLELGAIYSAGKEQVALVPLEVLAALTPGDKLDSAARAWGQNHGERLKEALGDEMESTGVESLANHLGGTTAALGLGTMSVEIQGDVLMFRVISSNDDGDTGCGMLCGGFFAGYLSAVYENEFDALLVDDGNKGRLFWVGNSKAVSRVRGWMNEGTEPLAAIGRLFERSH